jgi:hypothetical protein
VNVGSFCCDRRVEGLAALAIDLLGPRVNEIGKDCADAVYVYSGDTTNRHSYAISHRSAELPIYLLTGCLLELRNSMRFASENYQLLQGRGIIYSSSSQTRPGGTVLYYCLRASLQALIPCCIRHYHSIGINITN